VIDKDEEKASSAQSEAEVAVVDVVEGQEVRKYLEGADYVFHLAAITDHELSFKVPSLVNRNNILGTMEVLRECSRAGIKRMIYTSSAGVYGEAVKVPIGESHQTTPISPYGITKLVAERYCYAFHRSFGLPTTSLRLFNVYGPGQRPESYSAVITRFFSGVSKGAATIYGDGEQTRDFVFVDDVVDALIAAAGSDAAVGEVMNIGSGTGTTVNRLLSMVCDLIGETPSIEREAQRPGQIYRSEADISLARKLIGYQPKTTLTDGLRRYGDWLKRGG